MARNARRGATLLVALLAFATHLAALDLTATARTTTGLVYGVAKEIALDTGYKVSELDWALQPVFTAGSALELSTGFGLRGSLEVSSAFAGPSGSITDSDFLNGDGVKTHFSRHDCFTESALFVQAEAGWAFTIERIVTIEPYLALGYMRFKWTARDGYLQYPPEAYPGPYTPWSPSTPKILATGTGIAYEQRYVYPALGVTGSVRFLDRFDAKVSFDFSPLVSCDDLDNHFLRQIDFTENMRQGLLIEPGVELGYRVNDRARLSLDASYRKIWSLVGDAVIRSTGTGTQPDPQTYTDAGAAAYDALSVRLSLGLSL